MPGRAVSDACPAGPHHIPVPLNAGRRLWRALLPSQVDGGQFLVAACVQAHVGTRVRVAVPAVEVEYLCGAVVDA